MRTARTEIRQARCDFFGIVGLARVRQLGKARADGIGVAPFLDQDITQLFRDPNRIKRAMDRKQFFTMERTRPALVPAIDPTPATVVKDGFFDLHLDQLALFFDDDDQIQTFGPVMERFHIQRPRLPHFVGGDPQTFGFVFIDVQQRHRMAQIKPVLTRRDKPDFRTGFTPNTFVHFIRAGKRLGRVTFVLDDPLFLRMRCIAQTDVQTAFGHRIVWLHQLKPIQTRIDHRRRLDRVFHGF